ncbi:MAG: hypothetical protein HYX79_08985 [Chloroflexi bacterium]|nr:hypothetical protein [Chloroflexota bacterium]
MTLLWVLVALAGLAALFVLALSVPLDVTLRIDVQGKPQFTVRLRWLFGLVTREVKPQRKKAEERKPSNIRGQAKFVFEILRTDGLLKQVRGLLRDILRRIKVKELKADFRVGLGNPIETGLLFAAMAPAKALAGIAGPFDIRVQPVFDETVFEGYSYIEARMRPIRLVMPLTRFVFSKPVIRTLRKLALRRWRRRERMPAVRWKLPASP